MHTIEAVLWERAHVAPNPWPSYLPQLQLQHAPVCNESTMRIVPCVFRGAVSDTDLDGFVRLNSDQEISTRGVASDAVGSYTHGGAGPEAMKLDEEGTRQTTLGHLVHHGSARGTYRPILSFNYSSYAPILQPLTDAGMFEGVPFPDRSDTFLGDLEHDKATTVMHINQFEVSTTVQVVGDKLWSFMTPACWHREMRTFRVGPMAFPYYVAADAWERCEVTTVLARPGDVVVFPRGWPHQLYTMAGPNIMVNFRSDAVDVTSPVDVAAMMVSKILQMREEKISTCSAAAAAPSTFAHGGAPTPSTWIGRKKHALLTKGGRELDFRHCWYSAGLANIVKNYWAAVGRNAPDDAAGRHVLHQLRRFHGRVE